MKCETPARSLRSSREPAPIQKPIETERTLGTFSEITRSPESSSERTYFCTDPTIQRRASRRAWRNGARCTGALGVAIARTQGAPIVVLSARPRTRQRGVQRGRAAQPLFRQALLGHRSLHDRGRSRDDQDRRDGPQERSDRQPPGEARAEERTRNRAGGADPEQRPVDSAGQVPDEARRADGDADDEVRPDRAGRLLADEADERR